MRILIDQWTRRKERDLMGYAILIIVAIVDPPFIPAATPVNVNDTYKLITQVTDDAFIENKTGPHEIAG